MADDFFRNYLKLCSEVTDQTQQRKYIKACRESIMVWLRRNKQDNKGKEINLLEMDDT